MEEKKTQGDNNPKPPITEGKGDDVFTQEKVDKIVSERLAREKAKAEAEKQIAVQEARAEAERLAKLTLEEKQKELQKKQEETLSLKERELNLRENKLIAIDKLTELEIRNPSRFAEFVIDEDADKMQNKIDILAEEFKKSVSEQVAKELAGVPPKDFKSNSNAEKSAIRTF